MKLFFIDWIFIVGYFALALGIGISVTKKGSKSLVDFFCSGRSAPWWLAGISMVATTFAADTPLAVTGIVGKNGIAGNWLWWNFLIGNILTVFLFARLWRRSEVMTDVEFTELRYAGKPAAFLRGFRGIYLAIPFNCVVMGWVTVAMKKLVTVCLNCSDEQSWMVIIALYIITGIYIILSGLWGVMLADFFQFIIAMIGAIALAVFSISAVGGIASLKTGLANVYGADGQNFLRFLPSVKSGGVGGIGSYWWLTFLVMIGLQWWSAFYPGNEPGGGGYIAQRMFSTKNEKQSLLATFLFNICHFALRPWPWILTALCALVIFPHLEDPEKGYPMMMITYMKPGWLGLMLVSFLAAFMSTISTQINWSSSYIMNDIYKRFINPKANEKHYILISRLFAVLIIACGLIVSTFFETVKQAWEFLIGFTAGTGLVLILRWYWWRINAWSEISSMIASGVIFVLSFIFTKKYLPEPKQFTWQMIITIVGSIIVWLIVTFITKPEPKDKLINFYKKVKPGGVLWNPIAKLVPEIKQEKGLSVALLNVFLGVIMIYGALFGFGKVILGYPIGWSLIALAAITAAILYHNISKIKS